MADDNEVLRQEADPAERCAPDRLCPVCTRRFASILAMYGLSEQQAGDAGTLVRTSLIGLCQVAGPWGQQP